MSRSTWINSRSRFTLALITENFCRRPSKQRTELRTGGMTVVKAGLNTTMDIVENLVHAVFVLGNDEPRFPFFDWGFGAICFGPSPVGAVFESAPGSTTPPEHGPQPTPNIHSA